MWQINQYFKNLDWEALRQQYGTPFYIYSGEFIEKRFSAYSGTINGRPVKIAYAVKANSNIYLLKRLAQLGAGFDIVSVGELERVLLAGADPKTVVFSGVGKTNAEIKRALEVGIGCFNVESIPELERIEAIAQELKMVAPVQLRINPNVAVETHPYISTGLKENKFGIALDEALAVYQNIAQKSAFKIMGVSCHIGSQITELAPFLEASRSLIQLADALNQQGIIINDIDVGGGLGIEMTENQRVPQPQDLLQALDGIFSGTKYAVHLQPGRSIVGNSAWLISEVIDIKEQNGRRFIILDSAMNDYMRPALYQAQPLFKNLTVQNGEEALFADIVGGVCDPNKVSTQIEADVVGGVCDPNGVSAQMTADIVGGVCESGDVFRKSYPLSASRGDLIAMAGVGAYGFSMSSNYNTRPRLAELWVENGAIKLIRKREELSALWAEEIYE